jgi:cytochrome P450
MKGVIKALKTRLKYISTIAQAPYLQKYLLGNPLVRGITSLLRDADSINPTKYLINFITQQVQRNESKDRGASELGDLLGHFKHFKDGEKVINDTELISHASANILAGSNTTATTLRALFYNLCRNREAHDKLIAEINDAEAHGRLSNPVTFKEAQRLTYFQAIIKKALCIHPAVGLLLERVMPEGGAKVGGI